MRVIISPAKNMRIERDSFDVKRLPMFIEDTKLLCEKIRALSYDEAKALWNCNDKIARLNFMRFAEMQLEKTLTPAIMSFDGLQYTTMKPSLFTENALEFISDKICILSAFYGVLMPFDGIVPYRLEMNSPLAVGDKKNLYEFWGDKLYKAVLDPNDRVIINLSSKEYSRAIEKYVKKNCTFITCNFGTLVNGKVKQKPAYAKMARGEMVRFIAENEINHPDGLKSFNQMGFSFNEEFSTRSEFNFISNYYP